MLTFISRHRDAWPGWIILSILSGFSLFLAGALLTAKHPAAAEIISNQAMSFFLLCVTIIASSLALSIARDIWKSGKELTADMPRYLGPVERAFLVCGVRIKYGPAALPASTWVPASVHPDRLVYSMPGDDPGFSDRFEAGVNAANAAAWTLVLQRGNPIGMVYGSPEQTLTFERDLPPFQHDDWPEDWKIVPRGTRFIDETDAEFSAYVDRFLPHFREWSARRKVTADPHRAGFVFQQIVRASASALLVILCSLSAFSQKFEQVNRTPISGKVPPANTAVVFQFERSDLQRIADGKRTYSELLKAIPNYRDGGGGKLLSVWAGNTAVYKAEEVERNQQPTAKAEVMRPNKQQEEGGPIPTGFSMPTAEESAEMADRAKYEIWKASQYAESVSRPWWEVVMFAFWEWAPLILLIMMLCWIWAKVSATEGFWAIHRYAKKGLMFLSLSVASLFMVNIFLYVKYSGAPGWVLFLVAAAECGLFWWALILVNPDYRPAKGNAPARQNYNNNGIPPTVA